MSRECLQAEELVPVFQLRPWLGLSAAPSTVQGASRCSLVPVRSGHRLHAACCGLPHTASPVYCHTRPHLLCTATCGHTCCGLPRPPSPAAPP